MAQEVLTARVVEPKSPITFNDREANIQLQPHNDALVIVADIDHVSTTKYWWMVEVQPMFSR